jgi:membrane protein DedA with SNARE-associated domain
VLGGGSMSELGLMGLLVGSVTGYWVGLLFLLSRCCSIVRFPKQHLIENMDNFIKEQLIFLLSNLCIPSK